MAFTKVPKVKIIVSIGSTSVSSNPFVEIVRIPEALDFYRSKGLSFTKYIVNKNYALRNFFNFFVKILIYHRLNNVTKKDHCDNC